MHLRYPLHSISNLKLCIHHDPVKTQHSHCELSQSSLVVFILKPVPFSTSLFSVSNKSLMSPLIGGWIDSYIPLSPFILCSEFAAILTPPLHLSTMSIHTPVTSPPLSLCYYFPRRHRCVNSCWTKCYTVPPLCHSRLCHKGIAEAEWTGCINDLCFSTWFILTQYLDVA